MLKSRDCRGVPSEDAHSITPHSRSELDMTSDGFHLLDHPREDETVLAYVVERPRERYSRTVYTGVDHRTYDMDTYETHVEPRLTPLPVEDKWRRRMESARGSESLIKAVLRMMDGYDHHIDKNTHITEG